MTVRSIAYGTRIFFGEGALLELPVALRSSRVVRPALLLDAGVRAAGIDKRVRDLLSGVDHTVVMLDKHGETALRHIARGFRESQRDGIIALGGGSVIDAAKVVALCCATSKPLARLALGTRTAFPRRLPPIICVPTTAGTGSDLSRGAAVFDGHTRLVLLDHALLPKASICDPSLTYGLPRSLMAATAIDALTHCVEGFLSPNAAPPYDAVAVAGIRRLVRWLPIALDDPRNLAARRELMMGAVEGGMSMPLGLGAMHGIGVPMDGPGLHHGTVVGILAPHVLNFYERHAEPKIVQLRQVLGLRAKRGAFAGVVVQLLSTAGLPLTLRKAGVTDALARLAIDLAPTTPYHANSPVQPTAAEYRDIVAGAMA